MSESLRMWVEISFNIAYLVGVFVLIVAMIRRQPTVATEDQPLTRRFIWAFVLLASGDVGHVGLRVLAYAMGDLGTQVNLFGRSVGLVGLGALSTATTVTFFYVLMLTVWRQRFDKPYGWFGTLLFVAVAVRLVIMTFPQNAWNQVVPPWGWSIARNAPLVVQGLGVAYLVLRDARQQHDRTFAKIGWMIIASYAFYTPVILFVQRVPIVGMLMIPKTLAYIAIAVIGYQDLFPAQAATLTAEPVA